ncbi:nif domain containing protein [Grosmannia clavigera kw1407]|uniref:Mitochondrial import inner membrane translocase subunit TIM50 n=1 Tax=Grosmannia clavigera (strain kw1407 / UAMH 11150) TaxID=655863 RepID=F0XLT8_GROCL|nr:nif domain containing protein [Grosmannia clavigera kw1407]EFX01160.1 nif domain containing protein [Grosmannia clavigera kw1407]
MEEAAGGSAAESIHQDAASTITKDASIGIDTVGDLSVNPADTGNGDHKVHLAAPPNGKGGDLGAMPTGKKKEKRKAMKEALEKALRERTQTSEHLGGDNAITEPNKRLRSPNRFPNRSPKFEPQWGRRRQQQPTEPLAKEPLARERSPKRPPSEQSGGIPEPTAAYLEQAAQLLRPPAETPRPLLVVIDLNGTLLYRPYRDRPRMFVMRPHAAQFLDYCLQAFWVVVWSSARPTNVTAMCQKLMQPPQLQKLVAKWGRDRFHLSPEDYNDRVQCYKRLSALWSDKTVARSHPSFASAAGSDLWSQANTVLIDDSQEKARSEPFNLIAIPEFQGDVADAPDVLPQVHDYLNKLCFQQDVSAYMRHHPFRLDGCASSSNERGI